MLLFIQIVSSILTYENKAQVPHRIFFFISVTYANNEESRQALESTNQDFDQPRKMMLDIYTSNNVGPSPRPVIVSGNEIKKRRGGEGKRISLIVCVFWFN
jgi:hypothetical protein